MWISSSAKEEVAGVLEVEVYDKTTKNKKSVQAALACIGLALVSVFIPVAHFVLVPVFLIASVGVFFFFRRQAGQILPSEVKCPSCGLGIQVSAQPLDWPVSLLCENCRRTCSLRPQ